MHYRSLVQIATEMQTQPMDIEVLQWFSSY